MKRPSIWNYTNRDTGKVVKKVHMRSERAMGLAQLIDGLCSKYWRDRYEGDGGVPGSLTLDQVWETVRDEYDNHGDNNVWTWSDHIDRATDKEARQWAYDRITAVIPEMAGEDY
jgi:hypothetical protein